MYHGCRHLNAHNLNLFKCRSTALVVDATTEGIWFKSKQCMKIARRGFDEMIKADFFFLLGSRQVLEHFFILLDAVWSTLTKSFAVIASDLGCELRVASRLHRQQQMSKVNFNLINLIVAPQVSRI